MKKYLIGIGVPLLCISSYFVYDIIQVNSLRTELVHNIDQSNLAFIQENIPLIPT